MEDNNTNTSLVSDTADTLEVNEMLCFIQQKGDIIAVDHITKICADFYSADDVEKACSILLKYVKQKQLPKQKCTGKLF